MVQRQPLLRRRVRPAQRAVVHARARLHQRARQAGRGRHQAALRRAQLRILLRAARTLSARRRGRRALRGRDTLAGL